MSRKSQTDPKWKEVRRHRRSTKPYRITVKRNGIVQDITEWTIYFTLKTKMSDTDSESLVNKKITTHSDPTNGESLIEFIASEMDRVGTYYFSVDYKDGDGNEDVLVHGRMEFEETVRKLRD